MSSYLPKFPSRVYEETLPVVEFNHEDTSYAALYLADNGVRQRITHICDSALASFDEALKSKSLLAEALITFQATYCREGSPAYELITATTDRLANEVILASSITDATIFRGLAEAGLVPSGTPSCAETGVCIDHALRAKTDWYVEEGDDRDYVHEEINGCFVSFLQEQGHRIVTEAPQVGDFVIYTTEPHQLDSFKHIGIFQGLDAQGIPRVESKFGTMKQLFTHDLDMVFSDYGSYAIFMR